MKQHKYNALIQWTGNTGKGTSGYTSYNREHTISIDKKADIHCSSDPAFRGDNTKHNPEELLLASISSCHMLWYLHLCTSVGVVVTHYQDQAYGTMTESKSGSGQFTEVILRPKVTVEDESMIENAKQLHRKANEMCFIANSLNFEVKHEAVTQVG